MLTINGVELDFDIFDAETAAAYEEAEKQTQERFRDVKEAEKENRFAEVLRISCEIIRDEFDAIFGEGTSEEIFGERMNFRDSTEAFRLLHEEAERQIAEQKKWTQEIIDGQAKSAGNRTQRRSAIVKK